MTNTQTKLPTNFNYEHPRDEQGRLLLRKALGEIINSRRMGSTGHIARWRIGPFEEVESSFGRRVSV